MEAIPVAAHDRGEVEAEPVDVHLRHPVAQRVEHESLRNQIDEIKFQDPKLMKVASEALVQIRKSKSDAKLSMKAEIKTATLTGSQELALIAEDLKSVGKIAELKLLMSNELVLSDLEFASEE